MEEKTALEKLREWQNSPGESSKKSLFLLAFVVLVALVFLGVNSLFEKSVKFATDNDKETPYERRVNIPEAIFNAAGNVSNIGDRYLIIEAAVFVLPTAESIRPIKVERKVKVNITDSTKMTRLEFVLNEESGKREPREFEIDFEDINLGDYVDAVSSQNISNLSEFEAISLRLTG